MKNFIAHLEGNRTYEPLDERCGGKGAGKEGKVKQRGTGCLRYLKDFE